MTVQAVDSREKLEALQAAWDAMSDDERTKIIGEALSKPMDERTRARLKAFKTKPQRMSDVLFY